MLNRVERSERPPRSRLESWLLRKIQGGGLKALPRYTPLRGRRNECPEQYARVLLAGLLKAEDDPQELERLKDDGRAFRSWAETALIHTPYGGDAQGTYRLHHGCVC